MNLNLFQNKIISHICMTCFLTVMSLMTLAQSCNKSFGKTMAVGSEISLPKILDTIIIPDFMLSYQDSQFVVKSDRAVGIHQGQIVLVDSKEEVQKLKTKETIYLKDHLLSPGLVNAHTHIPMSLFRGLADDLPLEEWLNKYIFPLEHHLVNGEFVAVGTQLSALELIRAGVTTIADMYFYNDVMADNIEQAGLRALIGVGIPSVEKDWKNWQEKILALKEKYQDQNRIIFSLAPHAPYTVEPETLREIGAFSKEHDVPILIHVSESQWEVDEIKKRYGKTPVQHLHDLGITGKRSLFVHSVYLSKEDIRILKETGTSVAYNPESNAKIVTGIAPVLELIQSGIHVGLGTDGSASNNNLNLITEMEMAARAQIMKYKDEAIDKLSAQTYLKMATIEGAKAIGLGDSIGTIEPGKQADLIGIDLNYPHLRPRHNLISNLVYAANGSEPSFMMVDGKTLMKDYKIKTLNEKKIYKDVDKYTKQIQDFLKKHHKFQK